MKLFHREWYELTLQITTEFKRFNSTEYVLSSKHTLCLTLEIVIPFSQTTNLNYVIPCSIFKVFFPKNTIQRTITAFMKPILTSKTIEYQHRSKINLIKLKLGTKMR